MAEQHRCVSETASHCRVGWATVHAAFIDETRRGKPIWAQNSDTGRWVLVCDRWHTGFVDAAGTGGLLAQVEGRSAAVVTAWLAGQPQEWRQGITTWRAIDLLSASCAKAVREALPDAVLVADRFHLVRLGNDAVTAVRQRVIREHHGRRGRKVDPACRLSGQSALPGRRVPACVRGGLRRRVVLGTAKTVAADLAKRDLDLSDCAAVDDAIRHLNAEQLARRLTPE